jgi:hypothetical protein
MSEFKNAASDFARTLVGRVLLIGAATLAGLGALNVASEMDTYVHIPRGTIEENWPHDGQRAFLVPQGEESLIDCGGTKSWFSDVFGHRYNNPKSVIRTEVNGVVDHLVICGSADSPVSADTVVFQPVPKK